MKTYTAQQLARIVHAGHYRRDNKTEYVTHLEATVSRLQDESQDVQDAGWLHDSIEDSKITAEGLRAAGIKENVIEAVVVLTKEKGIDYFVYLRRVMMNEIARKVKIADMLSNLSDAPTKKQILKYCIGLQFLLGD